MKLNKSVLLIGIGILALSAINSAVAQAPSADVNVNDFLVIPINGVDHRVINFTILGAPFEGIVNRSYQIGDGETKDAGSASINGDEYWIGVIDCVDANTLTLSLDGIGNYTGGLQASDIINSTVIDIDIVVDILSIAGDYISLGMNYDYLVIYLLLGGMVVVSIVGLVAWRKER